MNRERGQTWIRTDLMGPHAVCVWVCLGEDRMLCIRKDGSFFVSPDHGFSLASSLNLADGVTERIA